MNEMIFAQMALYGVFVWTAVDRLKPTLKRLFKKVPRFNAEYQNNTVIFVAWLIAAAILLGDPNTRAFVLVERVPANVVWEWIDLALTASLVVAGDEASHRIVDAARNLKWFKEEAPNV